MVRVASFDEKNLEVLPMELTQIEKDRMAALKAIKEKAAPVLTPAEVKELADLEEKLAKKPY